ncbi:hypothetical protein FHS10_003734 [Mucilaginibacter dorajii]|nr:hypothetical protein [Mucilaginibacter dorajii]
MWVHGSFRGNYSHIISGVLMRATPFRGALSKQIAHEQQNSMDYETMCRYP